MRQKFTQFVAFWTLQNIPKYAFQKKKMNECTNTSPKCFLPTRIVQLCNERKAPLVKRNITLARGLQDDMLTLGFSFFRERNEARTRQKIRSSQHAAHLLLRPGTSPPNQAVVHLCLADRPRAKRASWRKLCHKSLRACATIVHAKKAERLRTRGASVLHRPPVSIPTTTMRHLSPWSNSAYLCSLSRRARHSLCECSR